MLPLPLKQLNISQRKFLDRRPLNSPFGTNSYVFDPPSMMSLPKDALQKKKILFYHLVLLKIISSTVKAVLRHTDVCRCT